MLLFCDELERIAGGDSPVTDISSITIQMANAATPYTADHSDYLKGIVTRKRAEWRGVAIKGESEETPA